MQEAPKFVPIETTDGRALLINRNYIALATRTPTGMTIQLEGETLELTEESAVKVWNLLSTDVQG